MENFMYAAREVLYYAVAISGAASLTAILAYILYLIERPSRKRSRRRI